MGEGHDVFTETDHRTVDHTGITGCGIGDYRYFPKCSIDLVGLTVAPWYLSTFNGGARIEANGEPNHPGIFHYRSSSSTENGGVALYTSINTFRLSGTEETNIIFRVPTPQTGRYARLGFMDMYDNGNVIDGVYFYLDNLTIKGVTESNNTMSETATDYILTANTWYRARIVLNADATRVDFYIYNDAGEVLWSDYLTTNIPKTAGRETGHCVSAWCSELVQTIILHIDYIDINIMKELVR